MKEDNDHRHGREETHLRFAGDRIVNTSVDCLLRKKETELMNTTQHLARVFASMIRSVKEKLHRTG